MAPTPGRRIPPPGVILFLAYAIFVLAVVGALLPWIVDQAISQPLSIPGIAAMALLAYTIFTVTLVIQRKQAARGLALGLTTLTIPAALLFLIGPAPVSALLPAAVGLLVFLALRRPSVSAWLSEP